MPGIGDELDQMGWNACSSCFDDGSMSRKYLLLPGVRSNNIHVVDTASDPRAPRLHKLIDGAEIKSKTNLSGPHRSRGVSLCPLSSALCPLSSVLCPLSFRGSFSARPVSMCV